MAYDPISDYSWIDEARPATVPAPYRASAGDASELAAFGEAIADMEQRRAITTLRRMWNATKRAAAHTSDTCGIEFAVLISAHVVATAIVHTVL